VLRDVATCHVVFAVAGKALPPTKRGVAVWQVTGCNIQSGLDIEHKQFDILLSHTCLLFLFHACDVSHCLDTGLHGVSEAGSPAIPNDTTDLTV
jgi:hypothetical protein